MQNPFLISDHVYLRPLEISDAPVIAPWFNDAEVTRNLLRHRPMSILAEEEFVRRIPANEIDVTLGIVIRETDQLIGSVGLHPEYRNRSARFGIALGDKASWGRGYGTTVTRMIVRHAFDSLNMNRVWLHVYEYNQRGIRVYEKVGFRTEGRLRQETYCDGRYWDVLVMGLLRAEWNGGGQA
jgi:RimJ/RimL family protein N-acetyltransferase